MKTGPEIARPGAIPEGYPVQITAALYYRPIHKPSQANNSKSIRYT